MMKNNNSLLLLICLLTLFSACSAKKASIDQAENQLFNKDYIQSTMLKVTSWQLKNPKHNIKDWTNGAFYAGVFAAWETTKSDEIYNALMDLGEKTQWQPYRRFYHADDVAICQTYLDIYQLEKKSEIIRPTIDTIRRFIDNPYPVRGKIEIIKWWWCDALFMAPPVMTKLWKATGNPEYLTRNDEYFRQCYDLLYNKKERLFARDLRYVVKEDGSGRKEANGQPIFWSRGNGWVMGGLVRLLQDLPADYPQRPFYEKLFKEMAGRIAGLQLEDGLWRASLLDPEAYPGGEVSGSGFNCYALAWGINNKLLDKKEYLPVVKKAWVSLSRCVNEEGRVGWVQPIGGDPQRNFSEDSWEVYGTGAFLLAGSEVIKLPKK
ncbi:MAG: glycoside hydrolase family 88 protein [Proteiniphilum sp.]|nr:glycoside hydrolase family 88 protein [Proteiniphilum sp.]MDD3968756.1 glycoside hydrolase family 88 protein [Proteiniphilum sp.]